MAMDDGAVSEVTLSIIDTQLRNINVRFDSIDVKLDKLTELTQQTNLQEYRLTQLEDKLEKMEKNKSDALWRVLSPILSAVLAAVVSFVTSGGMSR